MWKLATELDHKARRAIRLMIQASLVGLTIFYTVTLFINRELGFAAGLERPLVLTALFFIIGILERIEDRLPRDGAAEVTVYTDRASFYEATRKSIEKARKRVYVTYFRSVSPNELDAAFQKHLKACQKWANSSPEHVFRRVMINAQSPAMIEYFQQELAEVMRARANKRHYNIRLLGDVAQDVGGIAVGIYDDDQVFISYVSGTDRIVGIGIRGREVVRECFEHYYDHLWSSAVDIEKSPIGHKGPGQGLTPQVTR